MKNKKLLLAVLNCEPNELKKLKKLFKKLNKYSITLDEIIDSTRQMYRDKEEPLTYEKLVKSSFYIFQGFLTAYFHGRAQNSNSGKELAKVKLFIESVDCVPDTKRLCFGNILDQLPLKGNLSEDYFYFIHLFKTKL